MASPICAPSAPSTMAAIILFPSYNPPAHRQNEVVVNHVGKNQGLNCTVYTTQRDVPAAMTGIFTAAAQPGTST